MHNLKKAALVDCYENLSLFAGFISYTVIVFVQTCTCTSQGNI